MSSTAGSSTGRGEEMVKNASIARVLGWDAEVDAGAEGSALLALEVVVEDLEDPVVIILDLLHWLTLQMLFWLACNLLQLH